MAGRFPRDVHQAFHDVCHDFRGGERKGGGIPALASEMGVVVGTLYNKANQNESSSHHRPTLADAVVATCLSGDTRIAEAFAHVSGGVFVKLPDLSDLSTDALAIHLASIGQESGDFYNTLHTALIGDNKINKEEAARIEQDAEDFIAAIWETVMRIREMAGVNQSGSSK